MPKTLPVVLILMLAGLPMASAGDARPLFPEASGRECIKIRNIRDETAETDDSLIIHSSGASAYRNHLPQPCDGLRSINSLGKIRFEPSGDRLCKGDTFRLSGQGILSTVASTVGGGDGDTSTRCTLGTFEPITEMSITEALRR